MNHGSKNTRWFNSFELRFMLLMLLIGILPAATVGWIAQDKLFEKIREDRIKIVGMVADAKHDQLDRMLERSIDRGSMFLQIMERMCAASKLDEPCAEREIGLFVESEKADGAVLQWPGGQFVVGDFPADKSLDKAFQPEQMARFFGTGASNQFYYIAATEPQRGLRLLVSYPSSNFQSIFDKPAELGQSGETFLADGAGYLVTRSKYSVEQGRSIPIHAHPMQACLDGADSEMLDYDYADKKIIHGFRNVPELGKACIMAHIDQAEAFAPLAAMRERLAVLLVAFVLLVFGIAVYTARKVAQPVRKLAEAKARLEHSEKRVRLTVSAGNIGLWERDFATNAVYFSPELKRQVGYADDELRDDFEEWKSRVHPDDLGWVMGAVRDYVEGRRPDYRVEYRIRHRDGNYRWVLAQAALEYDKAGRPARIVGSQIDITERKSAEEEQRVAAAAFETHEAILITDASANILRVNRAFTQITGYPAQEVIGKNPRILNSGRQGREFYAGMWRQLLEQGFWSGEIWDKRKSGQIYPKWMTITAVKNDAGETTEYVAIFSDITARKNAEQEIYSLAFYDTLTGLPNRRYLLDRFRQAQAISARSSQYGALLYLDMDRFKLLNDTLGHDCGDAFLVEVARRMQHCVRESDTVARIGGDEFVVLLEEIGPDAEEVSQTVAQVAEKIRAALAAPYLLDSHEHHSSPSIGVCLYRDNEVLIDTLFRQADMAMYHAKESGGDAVSFFDPAMQRAVETRAALESDLRGAIGLAQLRLYYQIQVDRDLSPIGAEALIRWLHPVRGLVAPAQFIPIAEEGPLILDIGRWVLETACRQLGQWAQHDATSKLVLAVNVSAVQFKGHDFVETVTRLVDQYRVNPACLKLELTEGVVLESLGEVIDRMHALKALGVKLALDDFGTGYSSLSYLKRLPLDQIKIDQSFVRDIAENPNDAMMVETIIQLGSSFHMNVIAEGVETEAQHRFLEQHGCTAYQGYLFGKPAPVEEFEALILRGDSGRA